jgi:trimeric autotransporter adhesin
MRSYIRLSPMFAAAGAVLLGGARASAQCDTWIFSPSFHAPFQGSNLEAMAVYTPPGATSARIVVGGSGARYLGTDLNHIAQWNGSAWSGLGSGLSGSVYELVVWDSPTGQVLAAGGSFSNAGGAPARKLAAWNGSSWSPIGGGVQDITGGGWVDAMVVWDPDGAGAQPPNLVVAGNFEQAGTVAAQNIARWDGTTWRTFGIGLNDWVRALAVWDPDGPGPTMPHLIAAGNFTVANNLIVNGIARWDGVGWRRLGDGFSDDSGLLPIPEFLTTWDPDGAGPLIPRLVVAGSFSHADGVEAHGIAMWDGVSWQGFGTGEHSTFNGVSTWDTDGAGPLPAQLIASARRFDADLNSLPSPLIWDGSAFQPLGTPSEAYWVDRFATWDPDGAGPLPQRLVASGLIFDNLPSGAALGAMQLVGNEWTTFGALPRVYASAVYDGQVLMGGEFLMMARNPSDSSARVDAFNLVAWDGYQLTSPGTVTGAVRAIRPYTDPTTLQQEFVIGGSFGAAGGVLAASVARYRPPGTTHGDPGGWSAMGSGFNGTVFALERFGNATYAGGNFTASGATAVNRIARFTGSGWQPLGTGMPSGTVHALRVFNGQLYAGGTFPSAGGQASGGLARWNGTAWSTLGGAFNGSVYALQVYNNELVIGGQFANLNLVRLNTAGSITTLGGSPANGPVHSLAVGPDGHLYAGGEFTAVGAVPATRMARWDGTAWSGVRGGLDGTVHALQTYRNEVHAGGVFGKARGGEVIAPAWGRYTVDGIPWIARHPVGQTACVGQEVEATMYPAPGYFPFTVTWRHNGIPFTQGARPWGSNVELASAFTLRITQVTAQDTGTYQAEIATACGSVETVEFTILVNSADFDNDGDIGTDADIEAFFACLAGNCCAPCGTADFDGDGDIGTDADIEAFFRVLAGGAC